MLSSRPRFSRVLQGIVLCIASLAAARARAQGCIVARQSAPVLGAQESPYLMPGEWQVFTSYRWLRADTNFGGINPDAQRILLRNNVINRQQLLDIGATRAFTPQLNLTLAVPILMYGSWSVPVPADPPGPRQVQSASGLGDISLTARYWVLNTDNHPNGNISLGLGVKAPTGNSDAKDRFPDASGRVFTVGPVDQSIQPGDGGWGIDMDLQAFRKVGSVVLFASGTYLANPRNTNDTASSVLLLCGGVIPPNFMRYKFNSVPDQYLGRVGVIAPVPKVKGLSVSLAARMEGVPIDDLIGGSDGFRRPGYAIFVEPGITYTKGADTFSFSAPVATQRNIQKLGGNYQPGGTLADCVFLLGYSRRFGKHHQAATHSMPANKQQTPNEPLNLDDLFK